VPTSKAEVEVTPSMLDRLTDLEPDSTKERQLSSWEEMRRVKESLCRDLADLLNTRRAEQDFDSAYEQATNSLLSFGITDFTSYNLKSEVEQERVRRSIERVIRQFEPRLSRVTVLMEKPDPVRSLLRFQVEATLETDLAAEAILFDLTLHRESRRIAVSGANS